MRAKDPLGFTIGKHHSMNFDALAFARDQIRNQLTDEKTKKEEQDRIEKEEMERKRQERIRLAKEKKAKRRPWSKSPEKEENKSPFDFGYASPRPQKPSPLLQASSRKS